PGVEVVPTYDRSDLIKRAVRTVGDTLLQQFIIVALICIVFLFHTRSALVSIVSLPLGVLIAFIVMRYQGITANIVSLGGIAIAIGEMVDAAVVMVENAHRKIEAWQAAHPNETLGTEARWKLITDASVEVGPALFSSLLIVTISFVPVFALEAQEGRLFAPLAFTKSYAMAAAAGLAVTLVPVLMGYLIRGRIPAEAKNPVNRFMIAVYRPVLEGVLRWPITTIVIGLAIAAATVWPAMQLGGEFMPPLDEGDLLYMPSALPGLSAGKAAELLQQTDRLIKSVPEVARVFGKAGRAETATDPAPLEMLETVVQFKPRDQWRAGMTPEKLVEELDRVVKVPGLANIWVPPIRNRIDMLATGIKSPVGIKVMGASLAGIDRVATDIERTVSAVPGVSSALAERLTGGRYIDIDIDRERAARYALNIADVQSLVSAAIGGENIGVTVEGLQRFPINVRYPREIRDSLEGIRNLPMVTERGAQIRLSDVARITITDGPPMIKSENARLTGWVYVDIRGRDLRSVVEDMQQAVAKQVELPPGYSIVWSGQFEYLERATARLKLVVPAMLAIIFVMLFMTFRRVDEALLIMATLPFSMVGGVWILWWLGHNVSVASAVGFIGLAGVTAEFGIVMIVYLKQAWEARVAAGATDREALLGAIREGAVLRVRPKAMTVATTVIGLAPILWETGTGSEMMQRIAAPMIGGMLTAPLISMLVIPAVYLLLRRRGLVA
ncbi:MAG: efflux RND transporter permease subunit, partial [Burkholderiales bacterium]